MKVTYIADDGTIFDNEWACREYETNLKAKKLNIKVWDNNYNLLPNLDNLDGYCDYFQAATENDFNAFVELLEEAGIATDGLDADYWDGLWGWTEHYDLWTNYTEKYNRYKKIMRIE